jgi:syntaxin 7
MSFQDLEAGNGVSGAAEPGAGASQALKSGVFQVNTAVASFQRLVNTLGTHKDTPDLRERMYVAVLPYLPPPSNEQVRSSLNFV